MKNIIYILLIWLNISTIAQPNNQPHEKAKMNNLNKMLDAGFKFIKVPIAKANKAKPLVFKGKIFRLQNAQEVPLKGKEIILFKEEKELTRIHSNLDGYFQAYLQIAEGPYILKHDSEDYFCKKEISLKGESEEFINLICNNK